jgi:hypothetical protein
MTYKLVPVRLFVVVSLLAGLGGGAAAGAELVAEQYADGDLRLADRQSSADVYVDADDHKVVTIAAGLLAEDVERVTRRRPDVTNDADGLSGHAVLIGTLGQSRVIDQLVEAGKIDVSEVEGQWETFVILVVDEPLPGVERGLVIAGSDRRGTAFGVFEVSEQIGVSPWYWWADVPVEQRESLVIRAGTYRQGPPSVKYRGIFINDEDWGLHPWAAKTFDPEFGDIGPKTYEKVYELILRLKGNHLWPAMHGCTIEFGAVPENVTLAHDWAIVMGAAHCEPMNRNNVWWRQDGEGPWRYDINRENMVAYWREWAENRGSYEAVWTVGMRGIHDTGMEGPEDIHEQVKLLEQAIADQRELIRRHVDPNVEQVPQVFTPYKEALEHYQAGLTLPDDVTILWAEDNYGYIRQLSSPEEQKRSGGAGVYYHISYLGWPRPYLWLNTTPPALIWQQMSLAYDYGAQEIWMLNVGDIKPGEIGMEFWHRMAWDIDRYGRDSQPVFLREWAARDFGEEHAEEIAEIMGEYYRLGFVRKSELMGDDLFSLVNYREAEGYLESYRAIRERADALYEQLPERQRDAYYQLVQYPVRIAALVAETYINADFSRFYAQQGRASADDYAQKSNAAREQIYAETDYYNNDLADGKWKHQMLVKGISWWNLTWPATGTAEPTPQSHLGVAVQGQGVPLLPEAAQRFTDGTIIEIAAADGEITGDFVVKQDEIHGLEYVVAPNGVGNTLEAGAGAMAVYEFEVPRDGEYNLFMFVNTPTPEDDSWSIRINDGEWRTWNGIVTREDWEWKKQGTYTLPAGRHTLAINQREDGAMFSRIRFTDRPSAQRLEEIYADAEPDRLPEFNRHSGDRHFVDLFSTGHNPVRWRAAASEPWIRLSRSSGTLEGEQRVWVEIDWDRAPQGESLDGAIRFTGGGAEHVVRLEAVNSQSPAMSGSFIERDGYVSIKAENFTRSIARGGGEWKPVSNLGRTGDAVTVYPTTIESRSGIEEIVETSPVLEYDIELRTSGEIEITTYTLPTHRIHEGRRLRYAIAIGDETPQIVDFYEDGGHGGERSPRWQQNVSRNAAINVTRHTVSAPGAQTLRIWMVDPGVVVDKMVLDLGGLKPSYLGPPETAVRGMAFTGE